MILLVRFVRLEMRMIDWLYLGLGVLSILGIRCVRPICCTWTVGKVRLDDLMVKRIRNMIIRNIMKRLSILIRRLNLNKNRKNNKKRSKKIYPLTNSRRVKRIINLQFDIKKTLNNLQIQSRTSNKSPKTSQSNPSSSPHKAEGSSEKEQNPNK